MQKINATALANLLGVRKETITHWRQRGLLLGHRSDTDGRKLMFDLAEVGKAIREHDLPVRADALDIIEAL